ncbi:hypothetical protein FSP39_019380 [Pinctada imbricata]|uniref:Uncharacterized protein n=1 Tax=Pinctada imbricata TaxID=66713 RepID=A0AA89C0I6_PINIB|nr:hypothetical protein FSP39_019380 [Pinctada imbricata]
MELLCKLFLISLFSSVICKFDHKVQPKCAPVDKECEYEFEVSYMETMVSYFEKFRRAAPVVYRDKMFYRRNSFSCELLTRLTKEDRMMTEELNDIHVLIIRTANCFRFFNASVTGVAWRVIGDQQHSKRTWGRISKKIAVNVNNQMRNEGLSIHWHGMVQKDTPWMDGASMLTQCPINFMEEFQYRFKADPSGTHWYHSHHGTTRTDGVMGPLIVLPKPGNERKDIPSVSGDYIMMIQDWSRNLSSQDINVQQYWSLTKFANGYNSSNCFSIARAPDQQSIGFTPFHSGLINGKGHFYPNNDGVPDIPELPLETFIVKHDSYYRFRVINAALSYPFRVSIDNHKLTLIATDGYDTEPFETDSVVLYGGERFDILIKADAPVGNYWIRAQTLSTKDKNGRPIVPGETRAVLRYDDAPETLPESERKTCTRGRPCKVVNCGFKKFPTRDNLECIPVTALKSTKELLKKYPVPDKKDGKRHKEVFFNFHFASNGQVPYSAAINSRKFRFPNCPPQVTYKPGSLMCFDDCTNHDCGVWCKCTHTKKLVLNQSIQFVMMNDDDLQGGMSHPIHIHGHGFHVMKIGFAETDEETGAITGSNPDILCQGKDCGHPKWRRKSWEDFNVPDINMENPPIKDTVLVPRKGYVVLRFPSDNPGYWYMHCHVESHQIEGMTVILKEGLHSEMALPPPNFPLCRNFKLSSEQFEKTLKEAKELRKRLYDGSSSNDNTEIESPQTESASDIKPKLPSRTNFISAEILDAPQTKNIKDTNIIIEDDNIHMKIGKGTFVTVVLCMFSVILVLFGVIVWLYKSRNKGCEEPMLQNTPQTYYGSVSPQHQKT